MKPNIYKPSPVLLSPEIIQNDGTVQSLLFEYMQALCYPPDGHSLQIYMDNKILRKDGSRIKDRAEVRFPTDTEKLQILIDEPIAIYYDVFLVNNKLLAIGPCLPGMEKLIGKPKLFLTSKQHKVHKKVDYFQQDFIPPAKRKLELVYSHALNYLIIENLPAELLARPSDWELCFEYRGFKALVKIQKNLFIADEKKLTLISLQKNQSLDSLANWCDHYVSSHDVQRIVFYNNSRINPPNIPDLPLQHEVELWYVEWNYSFQLRFLSCQVGALTHANWWIKDAATHLMNFDPDEFLVNDSGIPLVEYLKTLAPTGLRITGYEVPPSIAFPKQHNNSIRNLSIAQNKTNTKYIFSPNHWQALFVHSARRYTFIINPAYWTMLEHSSSSLSFFLAKHLYRLAFWPSRLLSSLLRMQRPPKEEIYYLHYRSLNTHWRWPKSFYKRLDKSTNK